MASTAKGLRVPEHLERAIEREMERTGSREWSTTVLELIDEGIRMRRAPGIVFMDGPAGRRAVVAGTGLDVWEIIATWREIGEDYGRLKASYDWLTEPQLRAALSYYELYPAEIDVRLETEASWTPERVRRELPFTVVRD